MFFAGFSDDVSGSGAAKYTEVDVGQLTAHMGLPVGS